MVRRAPVAAVVLLLVGATGCTTLPSDVGAGPSPAPAAPIHWELTHRVLGDGLRVVGQNIGRYDESTAVAVGDSTGDDCFTTLSRPGYGGPDNKVGEQIRTTFEGHPAIRNGKGAEGDYLMWQLAGGSWVEVGCSVPKARTTIDRVAAALVLRPTELRIPFRFSIPSGYAASIVEANTRDTTGTVYLGGPGDGSLTPDADLMIKLWPVEEHTPPPGRAETINGRSAIVADDPRFPTVWISVGNRWITVGYAPNDTGPYPDRSAELPTIRAMAESLVPAADLGDPATWPAATAVLG